MAIDLNKQNIIKELLTEKTAWTSPELQTKLNVSASWVSKNSVELKLYGIEIPRKEHKEHKEHSTKGQTKLIANRLDIDTLTFNGNWSASNWLQIRFLVNQFHMLLNIPVPFAIESEVKDGDTITPKEYAKLEANFNDWMLGKTVDNLYSFLKDLKETILTKDKEYNKASAKKIFIHMFNIVQSYPYITLVEKDSLMLNQVKDAFKDIHEFEPTFEQIQVVAKAYKFATGCYANHKVASIQSDAGSSKTTCALVIQHMLRERVPYITAVTNKSLNNIKNSKTVASLLSTYADIEIGDSYKIKLTKAKANQNILPFIIVDESSQCGMRTRMLLETISEKVLYMGDQEQLPAIMDEQGVDFLYLHTLSTQYRFLNAEDTFQIQYSYYNKNKFYDRADRLLQTKLLGSVRAVSKFVATTDASSGYERYSDYTEAFTKHTDLLKSYKSDEHLVIAYAQNAVDAINNIINEGQDIKVGSKVMLVINQYAVEQFNGFIYKVIQVEGKRVLCRSLDTGNEFWYKASELMLAYAVTTMKIQGSQIKHVLGIVDTMRTLKNLDRYVITTRASHTIRFLKSEIAAKTEELIIQDIK